MPREGYPEDFDDMLLNEWQLEEPMGAPGAWAMPSKVGRVVTLLRAYAGSQDPYVMEHGVRVSQKAETLALEAQQYLANPTAPIEVLPVPESTMSRVVGAFGRVSIAFWSIRRIE